MSVSKTLDYESPHKRSAKKFVLKDYLLLGGGPTNCSDRVLKALSMQLLNPLNNDMHQLMDEVKAMTKYIFQTKNTFTLVHQTSGNGGNETLVTNLLDAGETMVVAVGGTWGEKVVEMGQRYNVNVVVLRKPPGETYSLQELEKAVQEHKANVLFVTHGETTGGILQKLEGVGPMCHKYDCLLAVDAVVSIAVEPLYVDRWEVDAVVACTQKAIGAPPGASLLTFSPRAEKRMKEKKTPTPYYYDMILEGVYWHCFENDCSRKYHYGFSSCLLAATREALAQICEEGLSEMWERHRKNTELFWKKLDEIGLECFVKKRENRFRGVTCVTVPEGIDQKELLVYLRHKYAIEITPGYGPTLNKAMRIGLMGMNSRPEMVEYLIEALQDGLEYLRKKKTFSVQSECHL